jgi:CheY-like chemotaxis protein
MCRLCVVSTEEARERAWRGGAWAFLAKPIQSAERIDELVEAMREVAQRKVTDVLLLAPKESALLKSLRSFERGVAAQAPHGRQGGDQGARQGRRRLLCLLRGQHRSGRIFRSQVADDLAEGRLTMIVYDDENRIHDDDVKWHRPAQERPGAPGALARALRRPAGVHAALQGGAAARKPPPGAAEHVPVQQAARRQARADRGRRHAQHLRAFVGAGRVRHGDQSTDNGRDAIKLLDRDPEVDIVLMDIMMPEMDGLETMREIRKIPACRDLPIIA